VTQKKPAFLEWRNLESEGGEEPELQERTKERGVLTNGKEKKIPCSRGKCRSKAQEEGTFGATGKPHFAEGG